MATFTERLITTLIASQWCEQTNNHDPFRFGRQQPPSLAESMKRLIIQVFGKIGFIRRSRLKKIDRRALAQWAPHFSELDWLYATLADDESRSLLVQLIAYRLMGPKAVRLPLSTPDYWRRRSKLEKLADESNSVPLSFNNWKLNYHDLAEIGFPLRLYVRTNGVMALFELQQYACERAGIAVNRGDVVIDGGGCFGDTALYFSHIAGVTGRVYTFEFIPSNLQILEKNLRLNSNIARRVEVVQRPLWNKSGVPMFFTDDGPASRVSLSCPNSKSEPSTTSLSIDDFVEERALESVDFIKMDIEGAEGAALYGAEKTIRKFKPKLALSVYHQPQDFVQLARFIAKLGLGYRFYLDHFTIHAEETVLFASVPAIRQISNGQATVQSGESIDAHIKSGT